MFTKKQIVQIEEKGLTVKQVKGQLHTFETGIPFTEVVTAATRNNGIEKFSSLQEEKYVSLFEKEKGPLTLVKFVPASGAATRMFKFLHQFLENYNPEEEKLNTYLKENNSPELQIFLKGLPHFAFTKKLRKKIRKLYPDYKYYTKGKRTHLLVKTLLEEEGLGYNTMPKGLIPFHQYAKNSATAFEEQLYEAAFYADMNGQCYSHFTFSEAHVDAFKTTFGKIRSRLERKTKSVFHISYSFQKSETDTLAVTPDNKPVVTKEGDLMFRPSGHGALLENLNEVDADVIFIKNIDNVVPEHEATTVAHYKKVLAGKLLETQKRVFAYLEILEHEVTPDKLQEIRGFLMVSLHIKNAPKTAEEVQEVLNRPIRVCGMVKNTGAPGGGPFWVKDQSGLLRLQIVELTQIDIKNNHQRNIVQEATHFNPVDLVCSVKNYKGEKFDLTQYANPNAGFISQKSFNGKPVKALELPGLWNGAMANWNTIFVEVPIATFNPVKTVNDLLKETHQVVLS